MQLALVEMQRRVQSRVPLPWIQADAGVAQGAAGGRPPARALRRHPARLDRFPADVPADGRHPAALRRARARRLRKDRRARARRQRARAARHDVVRGDVGRRRRRPARARARRAAGRSIRCSCSRSGRSSRAAPKSLVQRVDLSAWHHGHCPFCGWEPDFAVITPSAERRLICGRCLAQWTFAPLTCPFCANDDRALITSFATRDGRYRLCVRRLPPLSQGVRRAQRVAAGHGGGGFDRHAAARRGRDAARLRRLEPRNGLDG